MKVTETQARKMFDYLDKNRTGDLTYNEFCDICEERRRKIDNFQPSKYGLLSTKGGRNHLNHSVIIKDSQIDLPQDSIYRTNVDLDTLEAVSRLKPLSSTKNVANLFRHKSSMKVAGVRNDINAKDEITKLINHNFLRDYLEDKVTRNALEFHKVNTLQARSDNTKSSLLRNNKIAMKIIQRDIDKQIEDLKYTKAEQNDISFSSIDRKQIQLKKRFNLPPLISTIAKEISTTSEL